MTFFSISFNDKLVVKNENKEINKITVQNNRGYIEWVTGEECLSLIDETLEGDEIELFIKGFFNIRYNINNSITTRFLEFLTEEGEHTYGTKKENKLTINKEYREIPYIEIHDFKSSYNQQLSN